MQKKGNTTGERNRGTQGTQCAGEGKHRETQRNATGPMYRRGTLASNDHKLGRRRIEGKIAFLNPFNIFTHEFCSVQTLIIEDKQFYSILLFSKAHLISPPVRSLSPWGGSTIHGEGVPYMGRGWGSVFVQTANIAAAAMHLLLVFTLCALCELYKCSCKVLQVRRSMQVVHLKVDAILFTKHQQ